MANRAELHIIVDAAGQVQVTGPVHDKMICYALLELARDVIKDASDKAAQSKIAAPSPNDIVNLGTRRGGGT